MKKFDYLGEIDQDGNPKVFNRELMVAEMKLLKGRRVIFSIEEESDERSLSQLRYFRGYVVPAFVEAFANLGERWTLENMYRSLMNQFFWEEKESSAGEGFTRVYLSFSKGGGISKKLFNEKLEEIQQFAAENLDYDLKPPDSEYQRRWTPPQAHNSSVTKDEGAYIQEGEASEYYQQSQNRGKTRLSNWPEEPPGNG